MTSEADGISTDYSLCNQQFCFILRENTTCVGIEKRLNSTCSLHVLWSGGKKTVIHIDKDSFHVNWKKKKNENASNLQWFIQ